MEENTKTVQCPNCGASIQINDAGRENYFCTYCGSQIFVDTKHSTVENVIRNEAAIIREDRKTKEFETKERENRNKRKSRWLAVVLIAVAIAVVICLFKVRVFKPLYVYPPSKNDDVYIGMDYLAVKEVFWNKGFENMQLFPLEDIKDPNDRRIGKVTKVTIEGDDDFSE